MLDAMKSLRDEMLALQKKESGVDKTSDSAQANPVPGTSQSNPQTSDPIPSEHSDVQPMDLEPYGPPLPLKSFQKPQPERSVHSDHSERCSDSEYYQVHPKHKKHSDKRKHKSKPSH